MCFFVSPVNDSNNKKNPPEDAGINPAKRRGKIVK